MSNLHALWSKRFDESIVESCEDIRYSGHSVSLRIYETQCARHLKAMLLQNPVNLCKLTLSEGVCCKCVAIDECSEESVKRSSFLTYKGEVKVHGIVTIGLYHRHQRIAVIVVSDSGIRPCSKWNIGIRIEKSILIELIHPSEDISLLFFCKCGIVGKPCSKVVTTTFIPCTDRETYTAFTIGIGKHFSISGSDLLRFA